jgi:carbon-monoxide dehydrogenase medium subunit
MRHRPPEGVEESGVIVRTPRNFDELWQTLATGVPPVRLLAGGTVVLPDLAAAIDRSGTLVRLAALPLSGIAERNGHMEIGAMTTLRELATDALVAERLPGLSDITGGFATYSLRYLATVGGNLGLADADGTLAPALLSLDAQIVLARTTGQRTVDLDDYFEGPRTPDEVIVAIRVPHVPRTGLAYVHQSRRKALELPLAGVAARVSLAPDGTCVAACGIGLSSLGPRPLRAGSAEAVLVGSAPDDALIRQTAEAAAACAEPRTDWRASADYRRHLARVLAERAIRRALERARTLDGREAA